MNRSDQKHAFRRALPLLLSAALLTMAGPGMAHQPPDAEGAPEGITRATIVHEGNISAMSAMVLDAPQPALMIRYHGEESLVVYDSDNKPFLRFKNNRVEASTRSSNWQALPQSQGYEADDDSHWVQVSGSGSFGWVDSRLSMGGKAKRDRDEPVLWRIPVRQGNQETSAIAGRLAWRPIGAQSTGSGH